MNLITKLVQHGYQQYEEDKNCPHSYFLPFTLLNKSYYIWIRIFSLVHRDYHIVVRLCDTVDPHSQDHKDTHLRLIINNISHVDIGAYKRDGQILAGLASFNQKIAEYRQNKKVPTPSNFDVLEHILK